MLKMSHNTYLLIYILQYQLLKRGGTAMQWLELLPQSKSLISSWDRVVLCGVCMVSTWVSSKCSSFLLQYKPMQVRLSGYPKSPVGGNVSVNSYYPASRPMSAGICSSPLRPCRVDGWMQILRD